MGKTYRIKDIAELSGVSTGTVDRILHNRGKVSEEAQKKVEKVLKEIDYHPNLIARSLALKKKYKFVTLIPSFGQGEYWAKLSEGINKAEQELFSYNIEVERMYFNQYDRSSFDNLIPKIEEADCQGVIIATLFKESVIQLTQQLDKLEIPYVLIDAFIENTNCIAYYGTNSYDSGYIAGRLLFEQIHPEDNIAIFRFIRKGDMHSTQVMKREEGFREAFDGSDFEIMETQYGEGDAAKSQSIAENYITQGVVGIFGCNEGSTTGAGNAIKASGNTDIIGVGFDKSDAILNLIDDGYLLCTMAQNPDVMGSEGVKAAVRAIGGEDLGGEVTDTGVSVLTKDSDK